MRQLFFISLVVFLLTGNFAIAQKDLFPVEKWVQKLAAEEDLDNANFRSLHHQLLKDDNKIARAALTELDKMAASKNSFFKARLYCLEAIVEFKAAYPNGKAVVKKFFDAALKAAYETEDERLISYVCWRYGVQMYSYQEIEIAAAYCLRAIELNGNFLNQAFGYEYSSVLGEILFHCREYKKCIDYTRRSILTWTDTSMRQAVYAVLMWNTIGQAYQKLGMLDSALVNYERSIAATNKTGSAVWRAINAGYIGQVLFLQKNYKKAKDLLAYGYGVTKEQDLNLAANSLEWLAKINLINGNKDSALLQVKEALRLLAVSDPIFQQKTDYLQQVYYTTADIYRSMNKTDSFYRYFQHYITLHDSIERVAARSSFDISEMRNNNDKHFYGMQVIQREKRTEILNRNYIIVAIILLAVIAFLYSNRSLMKLRHKEEMAMAEITAAKEQLAIFTQNITETTTLVARLQEQLMTKELNDEQQELIAELSRNTILTDADWEKFKIIFEKIYPGFFQKLMVQFVDISAAEQRLAAFTRLNFTSKQISRMLGISVDSVHKTRQRLRQRLQLSSETNLKEIIARF